MGLTPQQTPSPFLLFPAAIQTTALPSQGTYENVTSPEPLVSALQQEEAASNVRNNLQSYTTTPSIPHGQREWRVLLVLGRLIHSWTVSLGPIYNNLPLERQGPDI